MCLTIDTRGGVGEGLKTMYNVFTDFHHASLLNSLIFLFEKRFGGKVYRPIGLEWAEKGFWHVFDHPFTREQFLGIGAATIAPPAQMYPDGTRPLNQIEGISGRIGNDGKRVDIYQCHDIDSGFTNKAITFDAFMQLPIDIVIASIPKHIEPFKRLCEMHPNHPKLIYQIGNAWSVEAGLAPNVMASAIIHNVPENINFISYHQEFDLDIFKPNPSDYVVPGKYIYSFMNCFNIDQLFGMDWQIFERIEREMPDWEFRAYGGQCRDGAMHGSKELADKIREAMFIWHTKYAGDGYGHVIHNSAAVGRPLIVKKGYYMGKMGEKLMIDGETCIVIDGLGIEEIIAKINYFSEPKRYAQMCKNVVDNFKKEVNFDKEFEDLQTFLKKLL